MIVRDIFDVTSGARIVAADAYKYKGNLPFIAAQTANDGIIRYSDEEWLKPFTKNGKSVIVTEPCITWTKNGYAGTLFYRDYKFYPGDDCGILYLKKEYRDCVNLKWFVYTMEDYIKSFATSKSGQGKLFDTAMGNIPLPKFPDIEEQNEFVKRYETLLSLKRNLDGCSLKLSLLLSSNSSIKYLDKMVSYSVNEVFEIGSGNSKLREVYFYEHKPISSSSALPVYSASLENDGIIGYVEYSDIVDSTINIYHAPLILVTRKGNAGKLRYISDGDITINDDAYIIKVKDEYQGILNLEWYSIVGEEDTLRYISSKDSNGTFSKELYLHHLLEIPSPKEQERIVKLKHDIDTLQNNIAKITKTIL